MYNRIGSETIVSFQIIDNLVHISEAFKNIVFEDSMELFFNRSENGNLFQTIQLHEFEFRSEIEGFDVDLFEVTDDFHDSSSDLELIKNSTSFSSRYGWGSSFLRVGMVWNEPYSEVFT